MFHCIHTDITREGEKKNPRNHRGERHTCMLSVDPGMGRPPWKPEEVGALEDRLTGVGVRVLIYTKENSES